MIKRLKGIESKDGGENNKEKLKEILEDVEENKERIKDSFRILTKAVEIEEKNQTTSDDIFLKKICECIQEEITYYLESHYLFMRVKIKMSEELGGEVAKKVLNDVLAEVEKEKKKKKNKREGK